MLTCVSKWSVNQFERRHLNSSAIPYFCKNNGLLTVSRDVDTQIEKRSRAEISKRDYATTYVANVAIILGMILLYRVAHLALLPEEFSQYTLLRRIYSFIFPVLSVGLGVALPRYVAFAFGRNNDRDCQAYFMASIAVYGFVFALYVVANAAAGDWLAFLFLGSEEYSQLMTALMPLVAGSLLHTVLYSYLRGMLRIVQSNGLLVVNLALIPLLAFCFSKNVVGVFWWTGFGTIAVSLAGIVRTLIRDNVNFPTGIVSAGKELLRYGAPRLPGDLAFYGLMLGPATISAHYCGVDEAGRIAFGLVLVNLIQQLVKPVSTLMLPEATLLISRGEHSKLLSKMIRVLLVMVPSTVIAVLAYTVLADWVLVAYLGNPDSQLVAMTRLLVPVAIPLNVFILLRSIVDSGYRAPVNSLNALLSTAVFGAGVSFFPPAEGSVVGILVSFYVSIVLLALLTAWFSFKVLSVNQPTGLHNTAFQAGASSGRSHDR